MARIPMVTRTITTTKVNVLCLNVETEEAFNKEIVLAGTFKNNKQLMKAVEEAINNEQEKAVHVTNTEEIETLYGMTEAEFIKNAVKLQPRVKNADKPQPKVKNADKL